MIDLGCPKVSGVMTVVAHPMVLSDAPLSLQKLPFFLDPTFALEKETFLALVPIQCADDIAFVTCRMATIISRDDGANGSIQAFFCAVRSQ